MYRAKAAPPTGVCDGLRRWVLSAYATPAVAKNSTGGAMAAITDLDS